MSRLTFIKTYFNSGWCYEPLLVVMLTLLVATPPLYKRPYIGT